MVLSHVINTYVDDIPKLWILLILNVVKSLISNLIELKTKLLCFIPFASGTPLGRRQYRPIFEQLYLKNRKIWR